MKNPYKIPPERALLLFHLNVGIRVALKILIPVIAILFALFFLLKPEFFIVLAESFFGNSGLFITGLISTSVCILTAQKTAPRICFGINGWIRHLPIKNITLRRSTSLAVAISLVPILAVLAGLVFISIKTRGGSGFAYLAGLPFVATAVSFFVIPVHNRVAIRIIAFFSCILSSSGDWMMLTAGILLLGLLDLTAGPLFEHKKAKITPRTFSGYFLPTISWRALRFRLILPYLYSLAIPIAVYFFLSNNDFDRSLVVKIVRGGGVMCFVLFFASLSGLLAVRRPPWPWIRSLPWSSKQRILIDSIFFGFFSLPLVTFIGFMNTKAIFPVLGCIPFFAVLSAGAVYSSANSRFGAQGKILPPGFLIALTMVFLDWISLLLIPMALAAFYLASEEEQRTKVTLWQERHHLAAGDTQSWSQQ